MKRFSVALALLVVCVAIDAAAEETRLICTGIMDATERVMAGQTYNPNTRQMEQQWASVPTQTPISEEIRFDESTGEFWYKGFTVIGGPTDSDGWVRAKRVEFAEAMIEAEFDLSRRGRARNMLSFGLAQAIEGKPIGTLDRYSGIWRLLGEKTSCVRVNTDERRF